MTPFFKIDDVIKMVELLSGVAGSHEKPSCQIILLSLSFLLKNTAWPMCRSFVRELFRQLLQFF